MNWYFHLPIVTLILFITTIVFLCSGNFEVCKVLAILAVAVSIQEMRLNNK